MLKGKSALVTGSTSGIGLAIARALAEEGANVTINGFGDKAAIEKERSGIEKEFGVKAIYSPADMTKPAEIADMVKTAEKTFGSLDVLVNNAGIQFVSPIEDFPIDKWDQIIAINLSAAFHAIRAAVPGMKVAQMGPHHQHRLGPFAGRLAVQVRLCHRQARPRRPDQDRRARARHLWRHLQLHQPRLCVDAAGREANPRHDEGAQHDRRSRSSATCCLAAQPTKEFVTVDEVASLAVYLCSDRGEVDHRRQSLDRRRLDRGVSERPGLAA